jgi:adenosylhomocysteine nucleosidase
MNVMPPGAAGIVVALEKEAACLAGRRLPTERVMTLDDGCRILLCGDGPERAGNAAIELMNGGAQLLLCIGTAGALSPDLAPGDLVVPEKVIRNGHAYPNDPAWRSLVLSGVSNAPGAVSGGNLLTVDRAIARREDKAAAYRDSGAVAVDMESASVLECAAARGIRALALRVVLDGANTEVPDLILHNCDHFGRPRLAAMCAALLGNVRQIVPFLRIVQGFASATRTLRWVGRNRKRLLPST